MPCQIASFSDGAPTGNRAHAMSTATLSGDDLAGCNNEWPWTVAGRSRSNIRQPLITQSVPSHSAQQWRSVRIFDRTTAEKFARRGGAKSEGVPRDAGRVG